jgi:hypothetical protein
MRTFIALILCYCGLIVIIASIIENRVQTSSFSSLKQRIKNMLPFTLIGLIIFCLGCLTWPNRRENDIPNYYIGKILKHSTVSKLYVHIQGRLDITDLSCIISKIKQDSSKLEHFQVAFFLPGSTYNNHPYAYCKDSDDSDLWEKVLAVVSDDPTYDFKITKY